MMFYFNFLQDFGWGGIHQQVDRVICIYVDVKIKNVIK